MTINQRYTDDLIRTNGDSILEVRNASVTFDMDRGESRVLDDVSIDIERQEILGIVGESGSGKSMFASALLDAVVEPGQHTVTFPAALGVPKSIKISFLHTYPSRDGLARLDTCWEPLVRGSHNFSGFAATRVRMVVPRGRSDAQHFTRAP